jgi:phosphoadenosine phosphosulfate reductase
MPASPPPLADHDRIQRASDLLARIARDHAPAALASSFGAEDMVLIDLVANAALPVRIFTLDTGRLPQETHDLLDRTRVRYRRSIEVFAPRGEAVERYLREHGTNAFYGSVALREQCCAVRKVEPLARALQGAQAWITGLRRAQGVTRAAIGVEEFDAKHGIPKFNPLADWSDEDVWTYLREREVPWNALHDRGYPSIGCAPCTRAIQPGEDARAGRWWWEHPEHKECGLHRRALTPTAVPAESTR